MDLIRRKILLEDFISRKNDATYGLITATTFSVNILLTQTMDDMGLFLDYPYDSGSTVDYIILEDKLNDLGIEFPFQTGGTYNFNNTGFTKDLRVDGLTEGDYYLQGDKITINTEGVVEFLRTYNKLNPYVLNFDIALEQYLNYSGILIDGRNRITNIDNDPITGSTTYVIDTNLDTNIGTINQNTGFLFRDYPEEIRGIINNVYPEINIRQEETELIRTDLMYQTEGWNQTNVSLSALTKEEYLFGMVSEPEVFSDVFIERSSNSVFDNHLRLSEINNLDELVRYGNGLFKVKKE
jgi:hypothetical protein